MEAVEGVMGTMITPMLDTLNPCLIITPLDCFWEGSKLLGPEPPLELPSVSSSRLLYETTMQLLYIQSIHEFLAWNFFTVEQFKNTSEQ